MVSINEKQVKAIAKAVANTQLSYMQALDVITEKLGFTCFNAFKASQEEDTKHKKVKTITQVTSNNLEMWLKQEYPQFNLIDYVINKKSVVTVFTEQVSGVTDNFDFDLDAIQCLKEWLDAYLAEKELKTISSKALKALITRHLGDKRYLFDDDLDLGLNLDAFFLDVSIYDEYECLLHIDLISFMKAKYVGTSLLIDEAPNSSSVNGELKLAFSHICV